MSSQEARAEKEFSNLKEKGERILGHAKKRSETRTERKITLSIVVGAIVDAENARPLSIVGRSGRRRS